MTRTTKIILTVSILLNLLLSGALAGYAVKAYQHRPEYNKPFYKALSPEGQLLLDKVFQQARSEMKENFKEVRSLRHEIMTLLMAEKFDVEAFDTLTSEMMTMHVAMMKARMEAHKNLAQDLSTADRQQLAKFLSRLGGPGGGRHYKKETKRFPDIDRQEKSFRSMESASP